MVAYFQTIRRSFIPCNSDKNAIGPLLCLFLGTVCIYGPDGSMVLKKSTIQGWFTVWEL